MATNWGHPFLRYWSISFAVLWVITVIYGPRRAEAARPPLPLPTGPIRLWPGRFAYSWQACVDSSTGRATSHEATLASPRSHMIQQFQQAPSTEFGERKVWSDITYRLEHYPEWLVRGAVTFGLFHAVPDDGEKQGGGVGGFSLRDRFFGINFLSFGAPCSQRFSMLKSVPVTGNNGQTRMAPSRVGDCTVTIPIQGGLLALRRQGCLRFTVQHNDASKDTKLVTEIQGYSPLLIGRKEPVPYYRKLTYLSTQSVIHAYVMWRFHKYCIHSKCSLPKKIAG